MNNIEQYWQEFCRKENLGDIQYKEAFQFGEKVDWLAQLVVDGKKTATCSCYELYKIENEPLPKTGEYSIILNSENTPVAIIEVESVEISSFHAVPEDFALAEGEGTYMEWWDAHVNFFTEDLKRYNLMFTRDMQVVCERFRKVYPS